MFNYVKNDINGNEYLNIPKIIKHIVIFIILVIILTGTFGSVPSGSIGVKTQFGKVKSNYIDAGIYTKIPLIESVKVIDVKNQKEESTSSAASKDLQTVNSQVAVNYTLNPEMVVNLYATVGMDYKVRVIDPVIQEAVKSVTAKFTAEELITKRELVSQEIKNHLSDKLSSSGINVENFSIINFDFSKSFNDAIEAKVTAEQNALASKNKLEQIKYEKEQAIVSAQGRAEALRIESNAISSNEKVLELRAIEKWNGVLPQVTGSSVPFINI